MADLDYEYLSVLVDCAKAGGSDAFAALYTVTYQKEYRLAYHYLKDEYLAQDALQETYLSAFKNLYALKDPTLFISWLNQINYRVCFTMRCKRSRLDRELSEYESGNIHKDMICNVTPEDYVMGLWEQDYVMKNIQKLPPAQSKVIIMKYYQGMKLGEIAQAMHLSKSTVKRYLSSGRENLRHALRL